MEKRAEVELWLPDPIIQHIQSFMNAKESAQTTILSKSWYTAWLTSSNLQFDQLEFYPRIFENDEILRIWRKRLLRYADLNLKIERFKLRLLRFDLVSCSVANELIEKAIKVGATDLNLIIYPLNIGIDLPPAVCRSETLLKLSLAGSKIDLNCSRLKTLSLCHVPLQGGTLKNVVSRCPLIEDLKLFNCWGWADDTKNMRMLALKSLFLESVTISAQFFTDFSYNFPCLKNLVVSGCSLREEISMSSNSVEFITFSKSSVLKARFDVPNLSKLSISDGYLLPSSLSFGTSYKSKPDICIESSTSGDVHWFLQLNKLLSNLRPLKVSLSVSMYLTRHRCERVVESSPKPVVENLILWSYSDFRPPVCRAFFRTLFGCCCPLFITQYDQRAMSTTKKRNDEFVGMVHKRLKRQIHLYQGLFSQFDLERANVEIFDKDVSVWQPLLETSLLGAESQEVRFHLRWRQKSAALHSSDKNLFYFISCIKRILCETKSCLR